MGDIIFWDSEGRELRFTHENIRESGVPFEDRQYPHPWGRMTILRLPLLPDQEEPLFANQRPSIIHPSDPEGRLRRYRYHRCLVNTGGGVDILLTLHGEPVSKTVIYHESIGGRIIWVRHEADAIEGSYSETSGLLCGRRPEG